MNMPNMHNAAGSSTYYDKGSEEPVQETPLTIQKLAKRHKLTPTSQRMVIVLVGLPGRGKSFVARKLLNFLTWRGNESKIFNAGRYRRQALGKHQSPSQDSSEEKESTATCKADFFDDKNPQATALRHAAAAACVKDMLAWLDEGLEDESDSDVSSTTTVIPKKKRIAIFDATNSTNERRTWVLQECTCPIKRKDKSTGVVFVESICDDKELLEENFRFKISNSPDYKDMDADEALADLRSRVEKYESRYETITDDNLSYIKIFNLSSKLLVNHIYGRMAKVIVPALMAWNIGTRPVFLCRAGSTTNGINSPMITKKELRGSLSKRQSTRGNKLDHRGLRFRDDLCDLVHSEGVDFIKRRVKAVEPVTTGTSISGLFSKIMGDVGTDGEELPFPCVVMSSTMPRAVQTVTWESLPFEVQQLSSLNPLDKGDFGSMELEDIRKENPEWYAQLEQDPFHTRFPGGESYRDLTRRMEPLIIDIEQQVAPVVVASHVSILQVLIAYFRNTPVEKCTSIEVPMHTVMKFTPVRGGGWSEQTIHLEAPDEKKLCAPVSRQSEESLSDLSAEERRSPPIWGDHVLAK